MVLQNELLVAVRNYAHTAHGDQTRRYSDDPYIVHPERVMKTVMRYSTDVAMLAAALLHDVLEDTAVTKKELKAFLNNIMDSATAASTFKIVEELTDIFTKANFRNMNRKKRKMEEAARLAKVSAEAQTIKYADIIDNLDVAAHEADFAIVYLEEARHLLSLMISGNAELRLEAMNQVNICLAELKSKKISERI
jgi:(p)ppGpp synthase/HD superfamily hydrolase